MSEQVPCPIHGCTGIVRLVRFGDANLSAWGCDGPDPHSDSQVRNALARDLELDRAENEQASAELERRIDPVAWQQDRLAEALEPPRAKLVRERLEVSKLPTFATGFVGRERGALLSLQGMTTLSGRASSGKSWFAIGAAINSALDGWDVHYLAAEAHDVIGRRVLAAFPDAPPERFHLHSINPGVSTRDLAASISGWITSTRTLLVLDSVSTLLVLMTTDGRADRWDEQARLEMFLMRVRELTRGQVAILNISEANANGETKGRTLDHRSDVSISFKSIPESDAKEVRVVKSWEGVTGTVGRARVAPDGPGLRLIHEGPVADAPFETSEF